MPKPTLKGALEEFVDQIKRHHCDDYELVDIDQTLIQIKDLIPPGKDTASEWNSGWNCCRREMMRRLKNKEKCNENF